MINLRHHKRDIPLWGWLSLMLIGLHQNCLGAQTNLFPVFQVEKAREYLHSVSQIIANKYDTNVDILLIGAGCKNELGDKAAAEQWALKALTIDSKRTDIYLFLADLWIRQDNMEKAVAILRRAIQADPKGKGIYTKLGMLFERLGDNIEARKHMELAVKMHPEDAVAHLLLGRMLMQSGNLELAKSELDLACKLDPKSINAQYALYQLYSKLGDREAAEKTLQIFKELKQQEKSVLDKEDARNEHELDLLKYTAELHCAIAVQLLRLKQELAAEVHMHQAILINPQYPHAHELLYELYYRKGRFLDAKTAAVKLVELTPKNVINRLNLSVLLLQINDPTAESELQRVLELDPKQPQALHNLARFYLNHRTQLPQALTLCERLLAVDPIPLNYDLLGWAYFSNGKTNEAFQAAAKAVELDPKNSRYRERFEKLQQIIQVSTPK